MTDRDTFAAAALTGLLANEDLLADDDKVAETAYELADAMLRERSRAGQKLSESASFCAVCPERDNTSVGETGVAPEADRKSVAAHGACARPCSQPFDSAPTTDQERFVKFQSAVMNWISEATGFFHDDVLRTDDARDVITDACSRCWDAFDRISYPTTNHDAAPVAWAVMVDGERMYVSWCKKMCEDEAYYHGFAASVVPLYRRQPPSLTKEERQAIKTAVGGLGLWVAQNGLTDDELLRLAVLTLRGLLERTK